jgi:hypothetical protein
MHRVIKAAHVRSRQVLALLLLIVTMGCITGCAGYDVGRPQSPSRRSYEGTTLNSPVTDQNPHPGGDPSYPSSVSDEGRVPLPPERTSQ